MTIIKFAGKFHSRNYNICKYTLNEYEDDNNLLVFNLFDDNGKMCETMLLRNDADGINTAEEYFNKIKHNLDHWIKYVLPFMSRGDGSIGLRLKCIKR